MCPGDIPCDLSLEKWNRWLETVYCKQMARSETNLAANAEAKLIAQAQQGDAAAWEMLVRQHQEAAFRLGYLLLRTPAEAEDVAQEAFVRAFLALDRFDGERPFRPWLLQITRNLAKNRLRSLSRYWQMVQRWWHHHFCGG